MWQVEAQVDAEDRRDPGSGAGLDEAHGAVATIAIGERERGLAVLSRAGDEIGRHGRAVAERIGRCHVEVSEVHGTCLTPLPAGTAAQVARRS